MELTNKQIGRILDRIYNYINEENNGYCRVGWAIDQVMGKDFKASNEKILKTRIAHLATNSSKYIKEVSEKSYFDYDISKNSNYSWAQDHPLVFNIISGLITTVISVICSIIAVKLQFLA